MTNKKYWKDYSFIMRGKQRRIIIEVIDRPMTVTEIKKKANLSLAETSRVLRGFKKQGLAECMNPEDALGRVYQLTEKAEKIKKLIKTIK